MKLRHRMLLRAAWVLGAPVAAWAQGFQLPGPGTGVPGTPTSDMSQANRFSNEFNPAFGLAIDLLGFYEAADPGPDGWNLELRSAELTGAAWIDPRAWAYVVFTSEGEAPDLEEASIQYVGLESSSVIRAGRMFIDFGKQMKFHIHDLRTIDRPAVLATYLGEEVKGDGVEYDDWWAVGDSTAVRASLGVFRNLFPEEEDATIERSVDDLTSFIDFNWTARLTGFTDIGESGTLQLGTSARLIPNYTAEDVNTGASADDLDNYVFGADLTYGWVNDTGERSFTLTSEYLLNTGDTIVEPSGTGVNVLDEDLFGFYVEADYNFNRFNSIGALYSFVEMPESGTPSLDAYNLYYTYALSEFQRLRLGVQYLDQDGDEDFRVALQYTVFMGAHAHDVNW